MNYIKYITFLKDVIFTKKRIITDYKRSIFDIDFIGLKNNADLVIFDFDDTLVDYLGKLTPKSIKFLKNLKDENFQISIFSNCTKRRAKELDRILQGLDINRVKRSDKPAPTGFLDVMKYYNVEPERTIAVGDKLGTEMYGAYLAGIKYRILVEPYSYVFEGNKANIVHRFVRKAEKMLYSSGKLSQ